MYFVDAGRVDVNTKPTVLIIHMVVLKVRILFSDSKDKADRWAAAASRVKTAQLGGVGHRVILVATRCCRT